MSTLHTSFILPLLLAASFAGAADQLSPELQRGLFEEEANQNFDAAIKAYQSVLTSHDNERKLAATALFRLGECYRKLGKTNDAITQYRRLVADFEDQAALANLSRQNLIGLGVRATSTDGAGDTPRTGDQVLLQERALAAQMAEARRLESLVKQLQNQSRSELRRVLPTLAPDELLNGLLQQLSQEEQTFFALSSTKAAEHPEVKAVRNKMAVLQSQIDERIEGVVQGLKLKAEALARESETLKKELASLPTARRTSEAGTDNTRADPAARAQLKELLQGEIKIAEQFAAEQLKKVQVGTLAPGDQVRFERDVLNLKRQLIAVDGLASAQDRSQWRELLLQEIKLAEEAARLEKQKLDNGKSVASEVARLQRDVLILKRELVTFDASAQNTSVAPSGGRETDTTLTDEEEKTLKEIKAIIRDSPDLINAKEQTGKSRLESAAGSGQVRVAEFLLANGADVNANLGGLGTPLHRAAERGHRTMTELLLRQGAEVNNRDPGGTPLHYAIENGHKAVAEVLIANRADLSSKGNGRGVTGDLTPLHLAAYKGFTTIAELLLAKGAQVNATDGFGQTPLHYAATYGHLRVAQALLSNKAEVNLSDNDGRTPLHSAVYVNQGVMRVSDPVLIARLLLENHAEVNTRITRGEFKDWTPLHLAAKFTDRAMTQLLLAHKADVNALTPNSQTPLVLAAANGKTEVVETLLTAGASVDIQTSDRATALGMAVYKNDERMVSAILARKPELEARNKEGLTPLQEAVSNRRENVIEPLLRAGAAPNVFYERDGSTPLHWAVARQQKSLVKLLLAYKADANARNYSGRTPLDLTKANPSLARQPADQLALDDIAVLLVEAGADEQLQRRGAISISRRSRDYVAAWFVQGSNTWNRFTLMELVASVYAQSPPLGFPDFTRVTISRLGVAGDRPTEMVVNVDSLLNSRDCSKDIPLEWGDGVEIPERDRNLNENWFGLGSGYISALKKCLDRKVEIIVKGEPTKLTLTQDFISMSGGASSTPQWSRFWLNSTLRGANVLRASSDLRRVKVRRTETATSQAREIILNLEKNDPRNDLWLRDGDVIEVPEKSGDSAASPNSPPANDASAIRVLPYRPPSVPAK